MKTNLLSVIITSCFLIVFCPVSKAQDWSQYLGPDRNSKSPQKGLLRSWPESGPDVLWSVDVGAGYGGPVIKNGKAYLLDRDDEVGDIMRCFDMNTGEELWKYTCNSPGVVSYPGSRSVPAVDDKQVYACGLNGELLCLDINTHQLVWQKNVWTDFGGEKIPFWAISQCPLIYGDLLIVASQTSEAGIVAYNKQTGDVVWKTPQIGHEISYSSPNILNIHGEDQVVMVTSSTNLVQNRGAEVKMGSVIGFNPRTGEKLWEYSNWECHITVPSPTLAKDNKLLIVGGYERGATMIQVNKNTDGSFEAKELFTTLEFGDQTKPALYHDGYFYAMFRTNSKREGLVCMDIDGNIMWKTARNPDFDRGSMILADGLFLASDGLRSLYLIEPDHTAFKEISKVELLSPGSTLSWAPLALSNGKLLIRDQAKMFCVKVAE
jgi:FOG: WD40-like repeat